MRTVILAGGLGTRISEESHLKPKPMVEIGGKPILWHIMKSYSYFGFNDFVICAGYKQEKIKDYFDKEHLYNADATFDFTKGKRSVSQKSPANPWKVTVVDTGLNVMTGGRIKRIRKYVDDGTFMVTYGDGVSDIRLDELLEFHKTHGKIATISAVHPSGRFGVMKIDKNKVLSFEEKGVEDKNWINGGFMVFEPEIFDYIKGDDAVLESGALTQLAEDGELMAFKHDGYWSCMDTVNDRERLENLWSSGNAPWKLW